MEFSDPAKNIAQFGVQEGAVVADLGAGSGYYAIAAAKASGSTGVVYAIEVQKDLLSRVKAEADQEGVGNLEIIWGDIEENEGTKLQTGVADIVLLCNVLFQVENPQGLANEADRVLKSKGRVLIVDWDGSYNNLGPDEESVFPARQARKLFEEKGYVFEHDIKAGAHHYGFSMAKI